ncbi:hypothetical protein SAMN05216389_14012 [Oceanobacillus limi]|uniref:Uncharacterized protein n=1 Tax=Oceanobacillus limi TaxID=930131 RepID=A0A1I0HP95_9BACI|nr:hypothetical protein [Oceanobacillus limi]SET85057.1 hypothetical protein SAMN05216389_14012 [Oceanobacillus limi]
MNDPAVFENPCTICRKREATQLCDYIIEYHPVIFFRDYKRFIEQKAYQHETCDLPLCKECARKAQPGYDFCPHHYALYKQIELPGKLKRAQRVSKAKLIGVYEDD